jgi:hypothetical protein
MVAAWFGAVLKRIVGMKLNVWPEKNTKTEAEPSQDERRPFPSALWWWCQV